MGNKKETYDLCIIGGGAAGFFCSCILLELMPNASVIMLEQSNEVLQKVKISGGGRCNVTNVIADKNTFSEQYPRGQKLMRQFLYALSNEDIVAWFETRGVAIKTESDGRMFPISDDSKSIIDCLKAASLEKGLELKKQFKVDSILTENDLIICSSKETNIKAKNVLIATGGVQNGQMPMFLPILKSDWVQTVPSLFTFKVQGFSMVELAGTSFPNAQVSAVFEGEKFNNAGPMLVTHWGFSGPAILKLSAKIAFEAAACAYKFGFQVNFIGSDINECNISLRLFAENESKALIKNRVPFDLSKRFWEFILQKSGVSEDKKWAELSKIERNSICKNLCAMQFTSNGKSLFKEEFVSAGGVDVKCINPKTMEYKTLQNVYFAGEILNVDGYTGGFNFQNAWSSAYVAAKAIAQKLC